MKSSRTNSHHDGESPALKHLVRRLTRPLSRRSTASWHGQDDETTCITTSSDVCPLVSQSSPLKKSASFSVWDSQPPSRPPSRSTTSLCRRLRSWFRRSSPDNISLNLWNEAYDSLRDNPDSAALVAAYEVIIAHQLPDQLKLSGAMSTSFRRLSKEERSRFMTIITENGLNRHRSSSSTLSQTDVPVRGLLNSSKDTVESLLCEYPSAAVAWAGISTLTPLLLQAVLDCLRDVRGGAIYLLARITWYTHVSEMLVPSNWKNNQDFKFHKSHLRDSIVYLYTKVLELEMNCVCAAASSWCPVARSVVGWNNLAAVIYSLQDADRQIARTVAMYATVSSQRKLLDCNKVLESSPQGCWPDRDSMSGHSWAMEKETNLERSGMV